MEIPRHFEMSETMATDIVARRYGLKVTEIKKLYGYYDHNYWLQVVPINPSPKQDLWPHGYILKVQNTYDSKTKHVEGEHAAERFLAQKGYNCPLPLNNLSGQDYSREKIYTHGGWVPDDEAAEDPGKPFTLHVTRLLIFQPGVMLDRTSCTTAMLYKVGRYVGGLDKCLQDFSHPAVSSYSSIWILSTLPELEKILFAVKDEDCRTIIKSVIEAFSSKVIPNYDNLRKGTIQGDPGVHNLVTNLLPENSQGKPSDIHAIIDFNEMVEDYHIFDLAAIMMSGMLWSDVIDPLEAGGHVLAGYLSEIQLNDTEFDCLHICVAGRYAELLALGYYAYYQAPDNEDVLLYNVKGGKQLKMLWETPKEDLHQIWRNIIETYEPAEK